MGGELKMITPFRTSGPARAFFPLLAGAIVFAAALFYPSGPSSDALVPPGDAAPGSYRITHSGQLLVAAPSIQDPRFKKTVIVMIRHDASGAFGLIINRVAGRVKLSEFYKQLKIQAPEDAGEISLHYGGPVDPLAVFVVHSTEKDFSPVFSVTGEIGVSPIDRILRAMARGAKPRRTVFTAGYAGWGPGQLENEMDRGDWYTASADADIVFDEKHETKWERAKSRRTRTL